MNIFVLSNDPIKSAQMLCDKHICKMIVESCQLLCNVFYTNCDIFTFNIKIPYKFTHKNHPCTKWIRISRENFEWLLKHLYGLLKQYKLRYNKIHKCQEIFNWILNNRHYLVFDYIGLTNFVKCMPEKYKEKSAIKSYKNYYLGEKLKFAKWKLKNKPCFVKKYLRSKNEKDMLFLCNKIR